ncbi:MAG: FAD-dependent oxidoreductase [Chloroflexota bacterium]
MTSIEPGAADALFGCLIDLGFPIAPASGTYAFASLAERRGAVIRTGRAADLLLDGDRVVGVALDGEDIAAGSVVAGAGLVDARAARADRLQCACSAAVGVVVEVEPVVLVRYIVEEIDEQAGDATRDAASGRRIFEPPPDAAPASPSPERAHPGMLPRRDQRHLRSWTTSPIRRPGSSRFCSVLPPVCSQRFLVDAPIRGVRCCPRPLSADGRPLIGFVPGVRGVGRQGHGPWGISTGPASRATRGRPRPRPPVGRPAGAGSRALRPGRRLEERHVIAPVVGQAGRR